MMARKSGICRLLLKMEQNDMDIKQHKNLLRKQMRDLKRSISSEQREGASVAALAKVEAHPRFKQATVVLLYHSLPDEVHTHEFVSKWSRSKQVLLPVVKDDELELYRYAGDESLVVGSFGIWEPVGESFKEWEKIEFALIPGMAFDREKHRLGRGKGYYDRLLPHLKAYKIGLCFQFQLLPSVPCEPFDFLVDEVITD